MKPLSVFMVFLYVISFNCLCQENNEMIGQYILMTYLHAMCQEQYVSNDEIRQIDESLKKEFFKEIDKLHFPLYPQLLNNTVKKYLDKEAPASFNRIYCDFILQSKEVNKKTDISNPQYTLQYILKANLNQQERTMQTTLFLENWLLAIINFYKEEPATSWDIQKNIADFFYKNGESDSPLKILAPYPDDRFIIAITNFIAKLPASNKFNNVKQDYINSFFSLFLNENQENKEKLIKKETGYRYFNITLSLDKTGQRNAISNFESYFGKSKIKENDDLRDIFVYGNVLLNNPINFDEYYDNGKIIPIDILYIFLNTVTDITEDTVNNFLANCDFCWNENTKNLIAASISCLDTQLFTSVASGYKEMLINTMAVFCEIDLTQMKYNKIIIPTYTVDNYADFEISKNLHNKFSDDINNVRKYAYAELEDYNKNEFLNNLNVLFKRKKITGSRDIYYSIFTVFNVNILSKSFYDFLLSKQNALATQTEVSIINNAMLRGWYSITTDANNMVHKILHAVSDTSFAIELFWLLTISNEKNYFKEIHNVLNTNFQFNSLSNNTRLVIQIAKLIAPNGNNPFNKTDRELTDYMFYRDFNKFQSPRVTCKKQENVLFSFYLENINISPPDYTVYNKLFIKLW